MEPLRMMKIRAAANRIDATLRELELTDAEIEVLVGCYSEVLKRRNRNHTHTKPNKLQYFALAMSAVALATSTLSLIIRLLSVC
nr:MAG TPA: hypothetical protein [Caudoviricetes sp.]